MFGLAICHLGMVQNPGKLDIHLLEQSNNFCANGLKTATLCLET
jgi:hypothetical protein